MATPAECSSGSQQSLSAASLTEDDLDDAEFLAYLETINTADINATSISMREPEVNISLPRVVMYSQWIHCTYVDDGKEKRSPVTIVANRGVSHPIAPYIQQVVMSFCSSTLVTLTNTAHGLCAKVRLAYHEPGVEYESCCIPDDCMHMDVSLYRSPRGGQHCDCLDEHVEVKPSDLNAEQMREYRLIVSKECEILNPTGTVPIRGQPAPLPSLTNTTPKPA